MSARVNNIVNRIEEKGKDNSMSLIFFPLLFLTFTGLILNNAQANGLETTPAFTQYPCVTTNSSCSLIANPTNLTGCQANATNCNINHISGIQFLNPNSPFTQLATGNFLGFFTSLFPYGQQINYSPYPQISVQPQNAGVVLMCKGLSPSQNVITNPISPYVLGCDMYGDFQANSTSPNCQGIYISLKLPYENNSANLAYSNTFSGANMQALGFPNNGGYLILNPVTFDGTNSTTVPFYKCSGASITYDYIALVAGATQTTSTNPLQSLTFLGFVLGAVILAILALGISFGGSFLASGANISTNDQGTKLAEVVGVGLLVWTFIYSEFGNWLSNLPLNIGNIAGITLTVIFFFGLYWRIFDIN